MPPLPEFNSGLGFCYFPDDAHYRQSDLQAWLPELRALGASWLTLIGSPARAIPESFIRALIESAIEPIIHIPIPPSQPIDLTELETIYASYARWGVHYVVLYDQPNRKINWSPEAWGQESLVSRFLDLCLPALQLADRCGLVPVLPPLTQGGDYWDTAFLDLLLSQLKTRNQPELLKRLVISYYAFTFNRPLDWGAGGQAAWPQTQPYTVPAASQDQRGFHAFEWYQEVIRARLGADRPLLMIAGGCRLGDSTDPVFTAVDSARHATCNIAIMQAMTQRQLPNNLLNIAYYLLAAPADSAPAQFAWYRADGSTLPVVGALKQQMTAALQAIAANEKSIPVHSAKSTREPKSNSNHKSIYHYLLLPTFEWGVSNWHWTAVLQYVNRFQPTCGFSIAEAQAAEYVTLVGNEQGFNPAVEQTLRAAGCQVERICGRDGAETQQRLNEMAFAGQRFLFETPKPQIQNQERAQ